MSRTRTLMIMLVPLDGSEFAEQAIGPVARFTAAGHCEVVLLQVVVPVNPPPLLPDGSAARREAERYLERVRKRLERRGIRARVLVRSGDPAEEILGCAKAEDVSLIAMSTHGRSGLRRTLLGSVAESVVRRARVPVLLVRGTEA